ncbi:MAG: glycosyltransferase, partial [Cetobacterium sp.]
MKISGVVVWYNPTVKEVKNIKSYIYGLDNLFIVDNSDFCNLSLLGEFVYEPKINYIPNYKNLGIAKALNIGCEKSIETKSEWILTMDQDSKFDKNFDIFLTKIKDVIKLKQKIAIFAPKTSINENGGYKNKVITSGNLVNLNAYKDVNGFEEEFFIDEVDFDFNFKLLQKGYFIYQFDDINMEHKLGDERKLRM